MKILKTISLYLSFVEDIKDQFVNFISLFILTISILSKILRRKKRIQFGVLWTEITRLADMLGSSVSNYTTDGIL
jgi:hypothetical protein